VDLAVFDMAVNSGPSRAARTLQAALGVQVDGKIGPQTIQAAKVVHPSGLISDYCDSRLAFLRSIAGWETFGKGWKKRVEDVRSVATKMAIEPSTP
jgi:lysozyme family protein